MWQKLINKFDEIKWNNPFKNYTPSVSKTSQVEKHHEICGINTYVRNAYSEVLNMESLEDIEAQKTFVKYLDDMKKIDEDFSKLPPLEKKCIVYRGRTENPCLEQFNTDFQIIKDAKIGDVIVPNTGYSYCGFEKSLAKKWANPAFKEINTIMYEIRLPKGAQVSRNLEHGGEVLMPRNARYKVVKKDVKDNCTNIILEYILPKKNENVEEINSLIKKISQ